MPYGPLPYDLALEKWRAGQEPQGQAAPYMPALPHYQNDWADALASNETPGPGLDPSITGGVPRSIDEEAPEPEAPRKGPFTSAAESVASFLEPLGDPLGFAVKKGVPALAKGMGKYSLGSSEAEAEEASHGQGGAEGWLNRKAAGVLGGVTNVMLGDQMKGVEDKDAAAQRELEEKAERDRAEEAGRRGTQQHPVSFQELQGGGAAGGASYSAPQLSLPNETKQGFALRGKGINDQGAANEATARLEGEYSGKHAAMYDKLMQEESELESRYKGMRETVEGSRDKAFEDYQQGVKDLAEMKIDPGRMYKDGGIPFIMTALAGAIAGGVASGVQGGPNPFLEQFDKMLNRDINAQAANIQNKRVVNAEKQNLVQYWYGRLKDVDAAKLAAKQTSLEMFNQSLQKSLYDFKDKDSQNRIKSAIAITEQAGGENLVQYGNAIAALNAANAANAAATAVASAKATEGALLTPEAFRGDQALAIFTPTGDGPAFMANSPEIAKEANKKIAAGTGLRSMAAKIAQAYAEGGNNDDLVSAVTSFEDKVRQASQSGALDEGTVKQRIDLFGKARDFDIGVAKAKWLSDPAGTLRKITNYANSEQDLAIEYARTVSGGRPAIFVSGIPVKGYGPRGVSGWMAAPVQSVGPPGREPTSFVRSGGAAVPKKAK